MLLIQCPRCSRKFRVPETALRKKTKCPVCSERFAIEEGRSMANVWELLDTTQNLYYYQQLSKIKGPVPFDALRHLVGEGDIGPETLVRRGTTGVWMPANESDGLAFPVPTTYFHKSSFSKGSLPIKNSSPVSVTDTTEPASNRTNLYSCPDCKRDVSRRATSCSHCGCSLTPESQSKANRSAYSIEVKFFLWVGFVIVFAYAAFLFSLWYNH
jgi:hypothetical protein